MYSRWSIIKNVNYLQLTLANLYRSGLVMKQNPGDCLIVSSMLPFRVKARPWSMESSLPPWSPPVMVASSSFSLSFSSLLAISSSPSIDGFCSSTTFSSGLCEKKLCECTHNCILEPFFTESYRPLHSPSKDYYLKVAVVTPSLSAEPFSSVSVPSSSTSAVDTCKTGTVVLVSMPPSTESPRSFLLSPATLTSTVVAWFSDFSPSRLIIRAAAALWSLSLLSPLAAVAAWFSGLASWTGLVASLLYLGRPRVRSSPGPEIVLLRPNVDEGDSEFSLDGSVTAGGGRLGCRCSRLRFALFEWTESNIQTST